MPWPFASSQRTLHERRFGWWVKKRGRLKFMFIWWAIVPTIFTAIGIWGVNKTLVVMPARYDALEERGVANTATLDGCDSQDDCRLTMTFGGEQHSWVYDHNGTQFRRLRPGDTVAVILDPRNPTMASTADDVEHRTDAGFGMLLVFSVAFGLVGLALFPALYMYARKNLGEWDRGGAPMGLELSDQPRVPLGGSRGS